MNKLLKVAGIATLVTVVGVVAVVGIALAQEPTPTPHGWFGPGHGLGPMGRGDWDTFDATAEALGLSPEQLFTELHGGKTLTDLAEEKGVDLQTVYDAAAAVREEAMRQRIEQAVEQGQLSREQADWMLQGIERGWTGGRGFRGHGCRPGGFFNPEGKDQPQGMRFRRPFVMPGQSL
jgi:hypothetical protein